MLGVAKHLRSSAHRRRALENNLEILRVAQNDKGCIRVRRLYAVNQSRPIRHLLREWALCAIGIVLHAKVFVDLEQPLLVRDRAQKFFPARIISKETRRSGLEAPVR